MEISKDTTVADLIRLAADMPEMMKMTLGGLNLIVRAKLSERNDGITDEMTLTQFYAEWYMPKIALRNRQDAKTKKERDTSMMYWARFTGDPAICRINNETVDAFVDGLYQMKKRGGGQLSEQTVKKHLSAISSVMVYLGPKNAQYKRAIGLMTEMPEFPIIAKRADVNGRTPTMEQFTKILRACKAATRPILANITPQEWFESVYLFLYATGIRCQDLLDARWNRITRIQNIKALVIPPEKEKTHRERIVPLNEMAIAALQKMPRRGADERIFQWNAKNENAMYKGIERERRKIALAAGLKPVLCTFHAIRRLTATMLDPAAAANVLGNNPLTCRMHYQTVAVAARAVEALPIPEGIKSE